ncbi:MerR family transcriptional regulator [Paracoccus aurantiacus]|uniref:MerR family transcriptional regulator n=1 Tax=Paracoccus aurantiacus TaxID=2599412 RepID=A0A5C6S7B3_9RHOB|nr:MerR family transcriptional regulator [Paracoccus aurantiacus]TXB70381.1 MerR family transcriptional regulator [Paracoccus aurantiacus]
MKKAAEAFRSIGEVSQLVGVAPHVLRYWETQFPLFSPVKRRDGRRYYRPDDVRLAAGLCEILREEGVTIRGAKKQMTADRGASLKARGAARLGGDFAEETDMAPTEKQAPAPKKADRSNAGGKSAKSAGKRKANANADTLPLFPDFAQNRTGPDGARPQPSAAPRDWIRRLDDVRTGLRRLSRDDATKTHAAQLRDRLREARAGLAA